MQSIKRSLTPPIISIKDAVFRKSPSSPELFPKLNFELPSSSKQAWAIIGGPSEQRTTLLQILRGAYSAYPPSSRSYPYLSTSHIDPRLRSPNQALQYVGFDAERGTSTIRGAYLSARYESRREITDVSLKNYLLGNTELNAAEDLRFHPKEDDFESVTHELLLDRLLELPVSNLSNGQTRRARIAKALLQKPEVLLLSSPFMGLDPSTVKLLSSILERLSTTQSPRVILSLSTDEHLPSWVDHVMFLLKGHKVFSQGPVDEVASTLLQSYRQLRQPGTDVSVDEADFLDDLMQIFPVLKPKRQDHGSKTIRWGREHALDYIKSWVQLRKSKGQEEVEQEDDQPAPPVDEKPFQPGEALVEMNGVKLSYDDRQIIGSWSQDVEGESREGLWWNIRRGERWGVFGPNGSGKTTLTALVSSDHPQAYSLPIKVFGKSRLPEPGQPGVSIFDLQNRIGFSSPELHAFFPKHLTIRQTLESAWAETPLLRPNLTTESDDRVSALLRWFQGEICPDLGPNVIFDHDTYGNLVQRKDDDENDVLSRREQASKLQDTFLDPQTIQWADDRKFREVAFPSQRLLLFLRAIIKSPDIVVLDEPYSGMDADVVTKCNEFLKNGETTAINYKYPGNGAITTKPVFRTSDLERYQLSLFKGLTSDQALVFISHRKEEVPDVIREWICLPEPDTGSSPRFGRFNGPMDQTPDNWLRIWGLPPMVKGRHYTTDHTPKTRRLTYNAYHSRYYHNDTPERREKRLARLRNRWAKRSWGQKEDTILKRLVNLPLRTRTEKLCARARNTVVKGQAFVDELSAQKPPS